MSTAHAQLFRLTLDCERQLDETSAMRNECELDKMVDRINLLNSVIANWRGIVHSLEDLGEDVLILSKTSGDSLSESESIMRDVNCLVSRLRDKYLSIKRERDEMKSFLDEVERNEMKSYLEVKSYR